MLSLAPSRSRPPGPIHRTVAPAAASEDATPGRPIRAPEARRLPGGQAQWITPGAGPASSLLRRAW